MNSEMDFAQQRLWVRGREHGSKVDRNLTQMGQLAHRLKANQDPTQRDPRERTLMHVEPCWFCLGQMLAKSKRRERGTAERWRRKADQRPWYQAQQPAIQPEDPREDSLRSAARMG